MRNESNDGRDRLQFSIRSLLIWTLVASLISVTAKQLLGSSEWSWFLFGGLLFLAFSSFLSAKRARRIYRQGRERCDLLRADLQQYLDDKRGTTGKTATTSPEKQ